MVPNLEAMDAGVRRFIGRRLDPSQGEKFVDAEKVERQQAVFVPADESVPERAEYIDAVRSGDLEALDEATAKKCGVKHAAHAKSEPKTELKGSDQ